MFQAGMPIQDIRNAKGPEQPLTPADGTNGEIQA